MRRNRRGNGHFLELGVILLINEILSLGFNAIPPVTLLTAVGQALLYVGILEVPWDRWDACISAKKVWQYKDYKTLVLSAIEHADDMHLYYNMVSFLIKGRTLEKKYGSSNFAFLLCILTIMTSGIYVALAILSARMFNDYSIMNTCAIGFSGVIFALKFITTMENPQGYSYIQGFRVPVRYASWVELIAIHFLVPNASFMGHLAGILAGVIYMKTFLGSIIDYALSTITGHKLPHSSGSYSRPSRREDNYYESNDEQFGRRHTYYTYGDSARYGWDSYSDSTNYGWRY